ncbi:hypothetical protein F2Q69_00032969 [Brassica cretica]|uniref:No apical meristem-associated C-terminal domain-containing protein n=1 Tax=Brassica cretica TaxID=69181 RepID=A0A8S9SEK5_BRACR|nr:hypothetical protein F2Q69_00032969 [Brassica cretica]
MGRYSYSQPSPSEDMFGNNSDSEYSETEDIIRRDQAELSLERRSSVIYPPQPEVEFGFPQVCYCGSPPQLVPSRSINGQGRLVYTCTNKDDGECHVWKWWDVAVMEEMRARDRHVLQLEEKVDNLSLLSDYENKQRLLRVEKIMCDNAKEKSVCSDGFEYVVGAMVVSDTDLLKKAHEIFFADQAKKFTLEHAWCTLRFEQKWLSLNAPKAGGGEKRKNVETTTQPSTTDGVVDVDRRPEGVKAAKARRNGGKGKSVSDYVSVWEMKKEDWEMKKEDLERKERLSKLSILDTLLAKTEPLSEAEEAVKNKLLAECF